MNGYENHALDLEPDVCGIGIYKHGKTSPVSDDPAKNCIPLQNVRKPADDQNNNPEDDEEGDNAGQLGIDDNGKVVVIEWPQKEPAYDPYKHREVKHPTTYFDTLIHLLKASLGTGILAMPNAFKNAGYVVGTIGTLLIGILCTYTIHLLVEASHELSIRRKVPSMTYPNTAATAFEEGPERFKKYAPHARSMTKLLLVAYQIGASSVYVVFISTNIKTVVQSYFEDSSNIRLYMLSILLPLVLISSIQSLKLLAPFSSVATVLTMASFAGIFFYIFQKPPSFDHRDAVGSAKTIPMFFGTVLFAMEAIGMVLPLENEMKRPEKFRSTCGVLNAAMTPIAILYSVVGLFGYIKYGEKTKGSITLNLPERESLANAIKVMLTISIYICYALSNFVAFDIMWRTAQKKFKIKTRKTLWSLGLRTLIVMTTFLMAIAVPNLELLISLIGALCLSIVGIALPAIINYLTFADEYRKKGDCTFFFFCLRNLLIVFISVVAFAIGVFFSVMDIIHSVT